MNLALFSLFLGVAIVFAIVPTIIGGGYGDEDCGDLLGNDVYKDRCPEAEAIIYAGVRLAVFEDPRMAASLLRLHFHDCFVNARYLFFSIYMCVCVLRYFSLFIYII